MPPGPGTCDSGGMLSTRYRRFSSAVIVALMTTLRRRIVLSGHAVRLHESGAVGDPNALTYLLVHGIGMSHRYLTPLHDALPEGARIVSVDLPGFGGLPKPAHDLDVPEMGHLIGELLAVLGITRCVLVGHSMGVQWAIEAARAEPARVVGVVLIGPVVDDEHRSLAAQSRALAVDTFGESAAANAVVLTDYIRSGIRWYLTQARHMVAYETEDAILSIRVPTLIIRGGDDPVAGADWCRRLRAASLDATLVEIADQQHNVQYSAPRDVAAAIERHVAFIGAEAAVPRDTRWSPPSAS